MTETWQAVARKEFEDAIRSRSLWALTGLFVVLAVGAAFLFAVLGSQTSGRSLSQSANRNTMLNLVLFLRAPVSWLVPITALLGGYKAIAGERESGSIKLLLSLPHRRRDVVFGKVVGRSTVVSGAVAAGFGAALVVGLVLYSSFSLLVFLTFTLLTIAYATAFTSIAVGFSAFTPSTSRAAAGAIGTFALFKFVWGAIPGAIHLLVTGSAFPKPGEYPTWFLLVKRLSPGGAYEGVLTAIRPGDRVARLLGGAPPFYLEPWFAAVVLGLWIILPTWIGYRRFVASDL